MDGLKNMLMEFTSRFPRFWKWVGSVPFLRRLLNRLFINLISTSTKPRPYPFSLWGPLDVPKEGPCASYVSWTGLVDRTYTGRHLPPADSSYVEGLPKPEQLRVLFQRQKFTPCPKSTALFAFFAQWFTDSFLRTDLRDSRKNTSNHEIDLCQIYGLNAAEARILRSGQGGLLRSEYLGGRVYPARLYGADGLIKEEFFGLPYVDSKTRDLRTFVNPVDPTDVKRLLPDFADTPKRKAGLYATGLERGNSTIVYSAISTIFLREHNRLCREMANQHADWDDSRLFETARNANIVQLLRVIVEDYINHLSTALFRVYVERGFAEKQGWYRTNRIAAEFNLLYRWHPLAPTSFVLGDQLPNEDFRYNNTLLEKYGVEKVLDAASRQPAGKIALHNTAPYLIDAEVAALTKSRNWRIKPYNAYRERFGMKKVTSFQELTGDVNLAGELEKLYTKIDNLELTVGLLAEHRPANAVMGQLMMFMVGADAFSQALTNPLLANNVYCDDCFSEAGLKAIDGTTSFGEIVKRNTDAPEFKASFTH